MHHEQMEFDIVIVGAGPAGLSAAIRLKQLDANLNVAVLEKSATLGAQILSGAVLEPSALNDLIPSWQQKNPGLGVPVTRDHFYLLTKNRALPLPTPKPLRNHGNYIISPNEFCLWLGQEAEQLGVNIFTGFAGSQLLYNENKSAVIGVQTGDLGLNRNGEANDRTQPGIQLLAKQVLIAEGCRGSLAEELTTKFKLRAKSNPQTYGIGLREVWKIHDLKHKIGDVLHTVKWPLSDQLYGGGFMYHFKDGLVFLGLVIGLDYKNPYLDPFQELQKFKTHPLIRQTLEGGECIEYGARALNEGGYQAIPQLSFPGGLLIGCSAGFVNVAKIKGIHNAMRSGMLAAETLVKEGISAQKEFSGFTDTVKSSTIGRELYAARNLRPAFHAGLWAGLAYSAIDQFILRGHAPWTFSYKPDYLALKPAKDFTPIVYPKADNKITFDKLTQVALTGTRHREDQPCHLKLKDPNLAIEVNYKIYASPESRYCPAAVYEIVDKETKPRLQINFANCIHCKTCDIKDPRQNIVWTAPEGGEGPSYFI